MHSDKQTHQFVKLLSYYLSLSTTIVLLKVAPTLCRSALVYFHGIEPDCQ